MENGFLSVVALVFPATNVEEVFVVALSFAFFSLVFFTEVTTARFVTSESVVCDKFAHDDEVFEADSLFEFNIHTFCRTRNEEVSVEFLAEFLHLSKTCLQAFSCTTHTYVVPHDTTEFLVERVNRTLTLDSEELLDACLNSIFCSLEFGEVC